MVEESGLSMDTGANRKVVIVTGASGGIGAATARLFATRGYAAVLVARSRERLNALAEEIRGANGEALPVPADVTSRAAVENLVHQTIDAYGRVDVLVNNAGRGFLGTVAGLEPDDLEDLLRLNVIAPVLCLQAIVPWMRQQGGGVIVNVSSVVEKCPVPLIGPYAASKIALSYLSDAARIELSRDHIAVVNVLPGSTRTDFDENRMQSGDDPSIQIVVPGGATPRGVRPEVVAEAIWAAVQRPRRQIVVGLGNRIAARLSYRYGARANGLFIWAINRYVPRPGEKARHPADDLKVAGGIAALSTALGAGVLLLRRGPGEE